MYIGIVAEGWTDVAVLECILTGALKPTPHRFKAIVPEDSYDNSDLHAMGVHERSNWEIVKSELLYRTKIQDFIDVPIDDDYWLVVQIDTDQCEHEHFGVARPALDAEDRCAVFVESIKVKLREWLQGFDFANIHFAVAVEETEAWLLPLVDPKVIDSSLHSNPKQRYTRLVSKGSSEKKRKTTLKSRDAYDKFKALAAPLKKKKQLRECATRNRSLALFLESIGFPLEPVEGQDGDE